MEESEVGSPTERCGFVLHVIVAVVSVIYTGWVLLVFGGWGEDPPSRMFSHILPTTAVSLFFAAPILYAISNASIVATPQSIESLEDSVTEKQKRSSSKTGTTERNHVRNQASSLPDIVDLDVKEINDLWWKAHRASVVS